MNSTDQLHILVIDRWIGFPNGMATTQRIRLIGQALAEHGAKVTVLIVGPSERPEEIINRQAFGSVNGIDFEYTSGSTIRPHTFIERRFANIKAQFVAFIRIIKVSKNNKKVCIYLWFRFKKLHIFDQLILLFAKILKIPVVLEINERPWSLMDNQSFLSKCVSPLTGTTGAVIISDTLAEWAATECHRRNKVLKSLQVPILVDTREYNNILRKPVEQRLVFAGSIAYKDTIRFIINSMKCVWIKLPDCKLFITGIKNEDASAEWLRIEIEKHSLQDKVILVGYLPRTELLELYASSYALLIPLFNDIVSHSRFPTKIGEYLASKRPIITSNVGSINKYFKNGDNAFIAQPGNPQNFGNKILEAFNDEDKARAVGEKGRQTAELQFTPEKYKQQLYHFFLSLCKTDETGSDESLA